MSSWPSAGKKQRQTDQSQPWTWMMNQWHPKRKKEIKERHKWEAKRRERNKMEIEPIVVDRQKIRGFSPFFLLFCSHIALYAIIISLSAPTPSYTNVVIYKPLSLWQLIPFLVCFMAPLTKIVARVESSSNFVLYAAKPPNPNLFDR